MFHFQKQRVIALAVLLAAAGCTSIVQTQPPAKLVPPVPPEITATLPEPREATAVMVTDTPSMPLPTATPAPTLPPTAENTPTKAPAASGAIIRAENAKDLVEMTVQLPGPDEHIAWLGSAVTNIPADLSPRPQMLLHSGLEVTPVTIGDQLGQGKPITLPFKDGQVLAVAPDGSSLVVQLPDQVALYGLDGKLIRKLDGIAPGPVGIRYAASGRYLAVTLVGQIQAFVFDVAGAGASQLEGFETAAPVYSAGVSQDGKWLAWVSRATMQFQEVNAPNSKPGARLSFTDFIGAWEFSPDSSKMALYVAGKLSIYRVPDAQELVSITTGQPVTSLAWSPDGALLAAGYGGSVQIWDAAALAPLASLPGPNTFTGAVSFAPDGRYLYSLHDNSVLGVWRVK